MGRASLVTFHMALMSLVVPCNAIFAFRENCLNSCSEDVNCTLSSSGVCAQDDYPNDKNIPGSPFNLDIEETRDSEFNYLKITWRIPQDGSFNFLTGFLVDVRPLGYRGHAGGLCFVLQLGDNWTTVHSNSDNDHGISLFINCITSPIKEAMALEVGIQSLPYKMNVPKYVVFKYDLSQEKKQRNDTLTIQKWSDQNGTLHIDIQNPPNDVHGFQMRITATEIQHDVFSAKVPAVLIGGKKVYTNMLSSHVGPHHIIVPGLDQKDTYTIYFRGLDEAGLESSNYPIYETQFSFPAISRPIEVVLSPEVDDNRLVIILVSVSILLVAVIIFCLILRGKIWLKLRDWVGYSTQTGSTRNNRRGVPRILPIYCFENANYVKAVESHVSLLRRYVDVLHVPPEFQLDCFVCRPRSRDHSWVDSEVKDSDVIIYLSPSLGALLRNDLDTSHLSQQDAICAQSIRAVREHRLSSQCAKPVLVTFDCFRRAELESLEELKDLLLLNQNGQIEDLLMPISLASFSSNRVQLENLDQLLFKVYKISEYPANFYPSLSGWRDCLEAKEVERFLSLSAEAHIFEDRAVDIEHLDANDNLHVTDNGLRVSSEIGSFRSVSTVDCDSVNPDTGLADFIDINEEPELSSAVPLMTRSSGFVSGSLRSENFTTAIQLPDDRTHFPTSHQQKKKHILPSMPDCSNTTLLNPRQSSNYKNRFSSHNNPEDYCPGAVVFDDGQNSRQLDRVIYRPKVSTSINSSPCSIREHDSPLTGTVPSRVYPNGQVPKSGDGFNNCDSEWIINNGSAFSHLHRIIPPSMCFSNSTSIDSVCERINKVNENAAWSN